MLLFTARCQISDELKDEEIQDKEKKRKKSNKAEKTTQSLASLNSNYRDTSSSDSEYNERVRHYKLKNPFQTLSKTISTSLYRNLSRNHSASVKAILSHFSQRLQCRWRILRSLPCVLLPETWRSSAGSPGTGEAWRREFTPPTTCTWKKRTGKGSALLVHIGFSSKWNRPVSWAVTNLPKLSLFSVWQQFTFHCVTLRCFWWRAEKGRSAKHPTISSPLTQQIYPEIQTPTSVNWGTIFFILVKRGFNQIIFGTYTFWILFYSSFHNVVFSGRHVWNGRLTSLASRLLYDARKI